MESFVKSDIFFFVTTICVLAITVLLLLILWNVLRVVKRIRKHFDIFCREVDGIIADVSSFRSTLRENQFGLKPVFDAVKVWADSFSARVHKKKKVKPLKEKKSGPKAEPDTML